MAGNRKAVFRRLQNLIYPLAALLAVVLVWLLAARLVNRQIVLPGPDAAFRRFFGLVAEASFWKTLFSTLWRSVRGFLLALLLALVLAALSGLYKPVYRVLSPVVTLLRSVPTISVILLVLFWLSADAAPLFIAFLRLFPSLYAAIYGAFVSVSPELIEMSRLYGVRKRDRVTRLYIPSVLPTVFTASKSGISLNLKIVIASEALAETRLSMGVMMQVSQIYLDMPGLMAWTVAAVLLSYLLEGAVLLSAKLLLRRRV
jgi:NitT/TauT family transport system permease protein